MPHPLSAFDAPRAEQNKRLVAAGAGRLLLEELVGVRLYTGPQYLRYNEVLRGLGRLQREERSSRVEEEERLFEGQITL